MPEPKTLKPNKSNKESSLDDISDFPQQETIALPESIFYPEGRYRPPSQPLYAGYYPINVYLYRGKKYDWCSCGHSWNQPFCNGQCKWLITRCRPITFNVKESGYYKLCNCKVAANAPFCDNTHKVLYKWIWKTHKGFVHWSGHGFFFVSIGYWLYNWYQ
jgi:CDGSH-type Zn-finger protein